MSALPSRVVVCVFGFVSLLACDPPAPPMPRPLAYGASCSDEAPCADGLSCLAELPGGYCTAACGEGGCGLGGLCDTTFDPDLCTHVCESHDDCREGYQCWGGGCVPACTSDAACGGDGATCGGGRCEARGCLSDAECGMGRVCRAPVCAQAGEPGTAALGDACTADLDCASGICLPADRGGVCTHPCQVGLDCADVTVATFCAPARIGTSVETVCVPENDGGAALAALCTTDADCASATCIDGVCTASCAEDADCFPGMICAGAPYAGGAFVGCRFPAGATYVVSLPDRTEPGSTFWYDEVALPPDVSSVAVQAVREGDPIYMAPGYLFQDGEFLWRLGDYFDYIESPNPLDVSGHLEVMNMPCPTSDRVQLRGGVLEVAISTFDDPGTATFHSHMRVRRGADPGRGRLEIALHLAGLDISAVRAPSNTLIETFVGELTRLLAQVGVEATVVSYHDVSNPALAVIDTLQVDGGELSELFRESRVVEGDVLSVFLVRSLEDSNPDFILYGQAGAIGGPVGIHGTHASGVAIAFDPEVIGAGTAGALAAGTTAAHEIGHYLGLFHTTERLRACAPGEDPRMVDCIWPAEDPIADTASGDTTNLMYWARRDEAQVLSEAQGFVLRRSHLVRWE